MKKPLLSIYAPVKNEKEHISVLLAMIDATVKTPHEVLIVYDSPNDNTLPVVKKLQKKYKNIILVRNMLGPGLTNALKSGVAAARAQFIVTIAADDSGPIPILDDAYFLAKKGCDFISGTRYSNGGKRLGGSLIGETLSRIANKIFPTISGSVFSDATTGLKLFKKSIFKEFTLESKRGGAVFFELAIKAQIKGLKLGEIPFTAIDRLYGGKSSFVPGPWIKEYLKWFIWGTFKMALRKKPKLIKTS